MRTDTEELSSVLAQFTGTEHYYKWSPFFRNFVLTDGAKFLAEKAGAFWLMDMIASHFAKYRNEDFVVAKLRKRKNNWRLNIEDGNDNILAGQTIQFSDFPLDSLDLYVLPQDELRVILLTSEY